MSQSQEFRASPEETIIKKTTKVIDENLQLTHSNTNQQMRGSGDSDAAYIAYDAVERHKSFQKSRRSYNEEQEQYTEQAFSSGIPVQPAETAAEAEAAAGSDRAGDSTGGRFPTAGPFGAGGSAYDYSNGSISFGAAETPKMWENTYDLQRNAKLQEKLEGRRQEVQRAYTQLSYEAGDGRTYRDKRKKRLEYHGKINIADSEGSTELARFGRLRFSGEVVREKITRKEYEDALYRQERKDFNRRVSGRLIFRNAKSLVEDETVAEDDTVRTMKRTVRNTGRAARVSLRRNIRTIKLQNNTYARLELAKMQEQVLKNQRTRLLSEAKRKQQRDMLKEAKTREQKRKLKKQMVQQRAKEEGSFIRRTRQNRMVKRKTKEYQRRVRKRTLSTLTSVAGVSLFFLIVGVILFLVLIAIFTGGTHYYASTVTPNDYSTITEATEYFRKLETDLDEYLNVDREALEADIEAEYGDEIYEYIYNLADFGFNANTLIAYLSAMYEAFTLEEVRTELDSIFAEMYTLTIEVKVEDREIIKQDPDTGEYKTVTEPKNICYITLEKKELEEIVLERLPEGKKDLFDGYWLATGGQQVYGPVMREDWTNLISSNFGDRIHPITKERKAHNGVDIAVPTGTMLYSAVRGTVILAEYSTSAGNWVKVQAESGWTVVMMHMDSLAVSAGQQVEQGDYLGRSGNTGNSTGPHLHLEVRDPNYKAINPIFIIPQTCAGAGKETEK